MRYQYTIPDEVLIKFKSRWKEKKVDVKTRERTRRNIGAGAVPKDLNIFEKLGPSRSKCNSVREF